MRVTENLHRLTVAPVRNGPGIILINRFMSEVAYMAAYVYNVRQAFLVRSRVVC